MPITQPNNDLINYTNVYTLSGNNNLSYYYRGTKIYSDGSENISEPKSLALTNEQQYKVTRIKSRTQTSFTSYTTPEGIYITMSPNAELFVIHNYVDNDNIDRPYDSQQVRDSFWYDVDNHRSYKVYLHAIYYNSYVVGGAEFYDWRVNKSYIAYRDASAVSTDGVYTFSSIPVSPITVNASADVKSLNGFRTWDNVNLNLYKNNSIVQTSTVSWPATLNGTVNLSYPIPVGSISLNDTFKLSVSVDGNIINVQDPAIISAYTMSLDTVTPTQQESFLGFTETEDITKVPDCQPTLNNANTQRKSRFIEDVDYSTGITIPQNIKLLQQGSAEKAATPDSNYSQYSRTLIRYWGVKTNRTNFNTSSVAIFDEDQRGDGTQILSNNVSPYSFPTDNLGSIPNVESLNYYTGYFNRIVDPYPLLNKKTAYFVKYLVDQNKDVQDPSLSENGFTNLKATYRLKDVTEAPTNAKASIISETEADELKNLEQLRPVFRVGEFPTPILYSQNSSNAFSSTLPITNGSSTVNGTAPYWQFYTASNEIYLDDNTLNSNYDSDFYMGNLTYTPGPNVDFPLSVEPDYTKFPPTTKQFSFEIGDEIRFENDESKSFKVLKVTFENIGGNQKVVLTLDKQVSASINKDFFVVRRFDQINNYVILDQQKPYAIPPSASSAPGILATEYQVPTLDVSPDTVIADLIEKGLI